GVPAGLGEVLGEVLRGAGVVGAVDRDDGQVRQVDTGVRLGDRGVVPAFDPAVEHRRDGVRGELEVVDLQAGQVVGDRDGRDVQRQLEDVPALAALDGRGVLLVVEVGVGAGEVDGAGDEHLPAGTGAGRVVGGEDVGPDVVQPGEPGLHGDLLGGGARPGDRAAVAAARGEREQRRGGRDPPSVPARC